MTTSVGVRFQFARMTFLLKSQLRPGEYDRGDRAEGAECPDGKVR